MTNTRMMIWLAIASCCWLAGTVLIGGVIYPDYSHASQFMSELGANGSPIGAYVNYLGFAVTEILLLCSFAIAWQLLPKKPATLIGFGLLIAYPILISVSAFSPCDFQCRPEQPTLTHTIHIVSGLLAYLSAVLGLAVLSWQHADQENKQPLRRAALFLTPVLLIMLAVLTPENPMVGTVQRIAETAIYAWLLVWLYQLAIAHKSIAE